MWSYFNLTFDKRAGVPQKGEHRDYTRDQGFGTGLGWDPEQEDVSTEESAGIPVITDVSARVHRTRQPLEQNWNRTGTFPDGQEQAAEISPPLYMDQAVPAGIASTHITDHRNMSI